MRHSHAGKKRDLVTELAALLTLAATKNQDRVGLLLFTDHIEHVIPPGKSRQHVLQLLHHLLHFEPTGKQTQFTPVLNRFAHMARRHSVVFLLSDFLGTDYQDELRSLASRHDVNAIHVLDSPKVISGLRGLVRVEDAESGRQRVIELADNNSSADSHRQQVQKNMEDSGIPRLEIQPGDDCVVSLTRYFSMRQSRVNHNTGG
ncbi:VWA domain-containing protein [Coraliomargarita sp. SDUM461004]|uniref:VWA domain-containing protein n=1 Tax=Thalassobacterium sedimentorum TaxID=3041258 RepID=A0ABU1AIV0_9BACT|nr:VWA domain-containing protein [Coraliomargarita sp. SDUM461004]MDQ8194741.1 VWA domain-containing protein [Coraliomargarita sp. SDUM461004]